MAEETVVSIKITKEISFSGAGDTLESRLRKVKLRGFPEITIYANATFEIKKLKSNAIRRELYSPQLHIYKGRLGTVHRLASLFALQGINIYHLDKAYDYIAETALGEKTEWTILPTIVERFSVPLSSKGTLNYRPLLSEKLQKVMHKNGWAINPEVQHFHYTTDTFRLINDGAHRVQIGIENGGGISVLEISDVTPGYPYYAIPQPYKVEEFSSKDQAPELKVHVLTSPAHKQLYRHFPGAGIMSGSVRRAKEGEVII